MRMWSHRFGAVLVWHLLGTAFPKEFQGSLLGCKLLFLKAVEGKVAPILKIREGSQLESRLACAALE